MKKSKGLELPINMIVVIAIAVLVLVVVAAFLAGRFGDSADQIALTAAFNTGCSNLRAVHNCVPGDIGGINVPNYAPSGQNVPTGGWEFEDICEKKGFYTNNECAKACGCSI